tara:strand:+ start:70 stop:744 length:675 start_codon:yes stop_codon:yes gene_type:complete
METKKTPSADLNRKSALFLSIGLLISLSLTFIAFEWRVHEKGDLMDLGMAMDDFDDLIEVLPTEQPPPKAPPLQQPEIVPIPDDEEIDETIEINLDVDITEDTEVENLVFDAEPEAEVADEIFLFVEENAKFPGGWGEWGKFLNKNFQYPRQAVKMRIEGTVHLSFVVDSNGVISDIVVTRGIGGGCDEEAIRVLKSSPKWSPGRQRGVAVKSRMAIQIKFGLK